MEIECGSSDSAPRFGDLKEAIRRWGCGVHDDGSVRTRWGMEIVTAPARGKAFQDLITDICKGLDTAGGTVDTSCGLHVHVDARDLTTGEILKVVRLYSKLESGLYSIVAPSRRSNHYSRMWGDHFAQSGVFKRLPGALRSELFDAALYGSKEEAAIVKSRPYKHEVRYHGLNLNAILMHGTIEFRLHQGSVNRHKILMWAAICGQLVQYAKRTPEAQIARMAGDSFALLCQVIKDKEIVAWMESRRAFFAGETARRTGAPVVGPPAAPEASERL